MRPNSRISRAVRTSAFAVIALASFSAAASAQARNLRDPGRLFRERPLKPATKAKNAATTYNLFFTPTFGWDDNNQMLGGQLKYASNDLFSDMPVAFSGTLTNHRFTGIAPAQNKIAMQLDGEVDAISNDKYILALSGEMQNTADIGTLWEFAPEFDWMLPKNDMFTGAVGAIAYMDRFNTAVGSFTTKGRSLGAVAYLNRGEWSFIPEYDFNSNWLGEDSFSIKVSKSFAKMNRDPRVIVGAAKHNSFVAGVRMTLH
jgi:hypothetical protein